MKEQHPRTTETTIWWLLVVMSKKLVCSERMFPPRQDSPYPVPSGFALEKSAGKKRNKTDEGDYTFFYLFRRIASLAWPWYTIYMLQWGVLFDG